MLPIEHWLEHEWAGTLAEPNAPPARRAWIPGIASGPCSRSSTGCIGSRPNMSDTFGGRSEAAHRLCRDVGGAAACAGVFPGRSQPAGRAGDPGHHPGRRHPVRAGHARHSPIAAAADRREPGGVRLRLLAAARPDPGRLRSARRRRTRRFADAFIAIGVSAAAMWVGVAGRPWPLPKWLAEIAERPMDTQDGRPAGAASASCSACSTSPTRSASTSA